jgi:heptose I phosphotransferase
MTKPTTSCAPKAEPAVDSSTFWQRVVGSSRRLMSGRADWSEFAGADWPDLIMQEKITDDFHAKQGRSTARWTLQSDGKKLVVYLKRHYELPLWRGLLAALWPSGDWSPAMQERCNLEWAKSHGLPVPNVAAAGEYLGPWGKLQSFLAIEELTDMLPLHEAIPLASRQLPSLVFRCWKAGLIREIARLARFLHDHKYFHKDLYLCHFFIPRADIKGTPTWRNRVFMIDFHRLAHHPITRPFWISKDLGQLLYSSHIEGINARDRLRFWRVYQGNQRRRFWGRCLRRMIELRGRLYQKHNAKMARVAA